MKEVSALMILAEVAEAELMRLQEEDRWRRLNKGKMKMIEEKEDECNYLLKEEKKKMVLWEGQCSRNYHWPYKKMRIHEKEEKKKMMWEGGSSSSCYHRSYKKTRMEMERNPPSGGWMEAYAQMPNSTPPIFGFEKKLYESDTTKHHNRLFIPKRDAYGHLLPALGYKQEDEQTVLKKGIQVLGLDQMGRRWELTWKWWPKGNVQVLFGQWSKLLSANGLEPNKDYVKGFVFRYGENHESICFIITSLRKEEEEEEVKNAIAVSKKKRACPK